MTPKNDIRWRIYLAFLVLVGMSLAIIGQAVRIQTVQGPKWRSLADSLTTRYLSIEAERGNVFSEHGRLLATSLPYFEVRVDLNSDAMTNDVFYENVDSLALCMAHHFQDQSELAYKRELIRARKRGSRYHLIKSKVDYPELQVIKSWPLFRLGRYKGGLIIHQHNKRETPFRLLAHRTIGYVREGITPVGLDGYFDEYLAGTQGQRLMQKIAGGTWMPINDDNEINPQNGKDLITTIDVNLQDVAEDALLKAVKKHRADHGCAVVMEVNTGKIRAIANIGKIGEEHYWEKFNYAVGEATEPGSTFKLASLMALLELTDVDITDSVDLEDGQTRFYDETMRDSEEHDHRNVTVQRAFEISSNVGLSKLVNESFSHEPKAFVEFLRDLRLDQPVGIEIKGEAEPLIKEPGSEGWSGVSLPWMAVGYEVQLTPLQILALYNAIANDGKMMKPYLVNAIREFDKTVEAFKPEVLNRSVCSDQTLAKVRLLLERVVENGTARNLYTDNYSIAGKTGTAQIADRQHGYRKVYQSSFVGYFPADEPLYSCIVVINAPRSGIYYGSYVAGPVFREIADKVHASNIELQYALNKADSLKTQPPPFGKPGKKEDLEVIYQELGIHYRTVEDAEWIGCYPDEDTIKFTERKIIPGLVPNVVGMGLKDALYLLENAGFSVNVQGAGKVRSQSVRPGNRVQKNKPITIKLS